MGSSYYGKRDVVPWWPCPLRKLMQIRATLHCGRRGHEYGPLEPFATPDEVGALRRCAHGCGCIIVEVST